MTVSVRQLPLVFIPTGQLLLTNTWVFTEAYCNYLQCGVGQMTLENDMLLLFSTSSVGHAALNTPPAPKHLSSCLPVSQRNARLNRSMLQGRADGAAVVIPNRTCLGFTHQRQVQCNGHRICLLPPFQLQRIARTYVWYVCWPL